MAAQNKRSEQKNTKAMTMSRVIRLLILLLMILIMLFLFLIARTIYLGQQEASAAVPESMEGSSGTEDTKASYEKTEPEETEQTPAGQSVAIDEIETGETLYDDPEETVEAKDMTLSSGRILIGDSRFAYLSRQIALDKGDIVIAKGGEYFTWFRDTAVPQLTSILDLNPNYDVIINMGLNDCANNIRGGTEYFTADYIAIINDLYVRYPTTGFYFASIGPIKGYYPSRYGRIERDDLQLYIDIFNYAMRTQCTAEYLELGEYLYAGTPTYVDNVHYDTATDLVIYQYIKENVRRSVYDPE